MKNKIAKTYAVVYTTLAIIYTIIQGYKSLVERTAEKVYDRKELEKTRQLVKKVASNCIPKYIDMLGICHSISIVYEESFNGINGTMYVDSDNFFKIHVSLQALTRLMKTMSLAAFCNIDEKVIALLLAHECKHIADFQNGILVPEELIFLDMIKSHVRDKFTPNGNKIGEREANEFMLSVAKGRDKVIANYLKTSEEESVFSSCFGCSDKLTEAGKALMKYRFTR